MRNLVLTFYIVRCDSKLMKKNLCTFIQLFCSSIFQNDFNKNTFKQASLFIYFPVPFMVIWESNRE